LTSQNRTITGKQVDLQELQSSIASHPESIETGQLMDELYWEALTCLQNPGDNAIGATAEQISAASHQLFTEAGRRPDMASAKWFGWYAGQLRCIVALLQARRSQMTRRPAPLIRRKYTLAALAALQGGEANLSQLARLAGIGDMSQASKVVDGLAREGLVSDLKEGTQRLIRLTATGLQALPPELRSSVVLAVEPKQALVSEGHCPISTMNRASPRPSAGVTSLARKVLSFGR
jgi:predicted transcriptional regulator